MLALVFARLARQLPATGGMYAYTRAAFGDRRRLPRRVGLLAVDRRHAGRAGGGVASATSIRSFPGSCAHPVPRRRWRSSSIWIFVGINVAGVGLAGRVQIVTTALKLIPLVVVGIGGVFFFQADAFAMPPTDQTPAAAQLVTVVTLTLWAFLGLECATIPAGSVRNPTRTIPLATIVGTTLTAAIYIVSTIGVMSLVAPDALASSTAPFADGARQLIGDRAAQLVALGAAVSCAGALNGWVLIAGQLPMAAAADGLFPRVFGHLSGRGHAGARDDHRRRAGLGAGGDELFARPGRALHVHHPALHAEHAGAVCVLRARGLADARQQPRPRGAAAIVSVLAFVYAMFAIYGAGAETVFYGFLLLLGGLPVYVWMRREAAMSCTNEYGQLSRVMLLHARAAFDSDERIAREWQALNFTAPPDRGRAIAEYDAFAATLGAAGARIDECPAAPDVTIDAIYVSRRVDRDAARRRPGADGQAARGRPSRRRSSGRSTRGASRSSARSKRPASSKAAMSSGSTSARSRWAVAIEPMTPGSPSSGDTWATTCTSKWSALPHYRGPSDVFHLMSILSPIDRDLAVVYSPLMPVPFRSGCSSGASRSSKCQTSEFDSMGANVLAVGPRRALMLEGNPITRARLEAAGVRGAGLRRLGDQPQRRRRSNLPDPPARAAGFAAIGGGVG